MKRFPVVARAPSRVRMGCIPPEQLEPPHYPVDEPARDELTRALWRFGWTGRPLLVYMQPTPRRRRLTQHVQHDPFDMASPAIWAQHRVEARHAGKYRAVTGSHRIAAARRAKVPCVPVVVLDKTAMAALVRCGAVDEQGNLQDAFPGFLSECLQSKRDEQRRLARLAALGGL